MRRWAVAAMAATLAVAGSPSSASAGTGRSPDGRVLVVVTNLEEAYDNGGDISNRTDMKNYVRTLLQKTPDRPDALLLQEVRRSSANFVAWRLRTATGQNYRVVVKPQIPLVQVIKPGLTVHSETAIILNLTTMKVAAPGGFITSEYDAADAAPGSGRAFHKQTYVLAQERSSGQKIALASLHFPHVRSMRSREVSNTYREKWTQQILTVVGKKYPRRDHTTIGGDFNSIRCFEGSFQTCVFAKFYSLMTALYNYHDLIYETVKQTGVDYIFTSGSPLAGFVDNSPKDYYSDHQFRWGMIGVR